MSTGNLFCDDTPPPHSAPGPSQEAADSMRGSVATLRERVLDAISESSNGLTCDELERKTGLTHQTASARIWELRGFPSNSGRPSLLADSGARRKTASGRTATVWIAKGSRLRSAGGAA